MHKIKHYRKIYRKDGKRKALRITLYIAVALILLFIGYSIAGPLMDLFSGKIQPAPSPQDTSVASEEVSQDGKDNEPSQEVSQPPQQTVESYARFISADILKSDTKLQQEIEKAKADGINTFVFTVKNDQGKVLYNTAVEQAIAVGAVDATPFDLQAVKSKLDAENIKAIPVIYTFKDHVYPYKNKAAAVWYQNTENYLWLDNAAEKGGKPWLNPYAEDARSYINAFVQELSQSGFEYIMLEQVRYAAAESNTIAGFGPNASRISRSDMLKQFLQEAENTAAKNGSHIILTTDISRMSAQGDPLYGGNPLQLGVKYLAPQMTAENITKPITLGDKIIENPSASPEEFYKAAAQMFASQDGIIVFAGLEKNSAEAKEIITLLGESTKGYILFE